VGRILAIDYGKKRAGIAVTDTLQLIANGLKTVKVNEIFDFLNSYVTKEKVDKFIVGYPKTLSNEDSEAMTYVRPFVKTLQNKFPEIEVILADERFTSKIAFQTMIDAGLGKKKRKNKELIDTISATLILQTYLNQKPL
jgi:putative holliday junction resolvase